MNLTNTSLALVTLMAASVVVSCTTEERPAAIEATPYVETTADSDVGSAVRFTRETEPIFASTLSLTNVASGRAFLEGEGYTYVDTNSLILVIHNHRTGALTPTPSSFVPDRNRVEQRSSSAADTIVWLAFENPLHDLGNHTAIITTRVGDMDITRLVELDVSTDVPGMIREGKIVSGEFVPGDVGTEGWLACMGSGLLGSAAGCALSNCAWGACMGAAAVATTVGAPWRGCLVLSKKIQGGSRMEFVSFVTEQKWNMIGPAAGVLIASVLGQSIDPSLAWLVGGSIMGGIMSVSSFRQKSSLRVVSMALFTGLAAGSIHFALSQFV